jgi:2-polyprenyl-6-methoxyphenol hydroxylase-like FAD-dependent oxidoreductase
MFKVEAVVIGAGVIGLAIARALALRGVQVLLLEKEGVVGSGTSSRNSEVIHAGLYYEPESLKALFACAVAACCITIAKNDACLTVSAASLSSRLIQARTHTSAICGSERKRMESKKSI